MVVDGDATGIGVNALSTATISTLTQMVVVVAMSTARMVAASPLTCWTDPILDLKLGSPELLPLPPLPR
ncbi:hypothetical protein GW17_00000535 [Ensete ventricosum]|nr:hypothetical protein GW17_00000535 [Ensete ventricosum]